MIVVFVVTVRYFHLCDSWLSSLFALETDANNAYYIQYKTV